MRFHIRLCTEFGNLLRLSRCMILAGSLYDRFISFSPLNGRQRASLPCVLRTSFRIRLMSHALAMLSQTFPTEN